MNFTLPTGAANQRAELRGYRMIVITGGAGFIGSALLWQLNSLGMDNILVVDNLADSSKWQNLVKRKYADYMHRDRFISLARENALPFAVSAIVHLGACSSTTESDADFLMENNFHYSRDLCRFALENGARFINASSAATYGDGSLGFSDNLEVLPKLRPLNMYGYSKQLMDLWLLRENLLQSVASLKFFNVYGPNEYHKGTMQSVIAKAFEQIGKTGRLRLFASNDPAIADGCQKRDFVYVKDCVRLIAWLLDNPQANGILNVGTGRARAFKSLGQAVFAAMNLPCAIDYVPMPAELVGKYQNYTCADMGWLAGARYPYKFNSLEEGVEDYVRNYLATDDVYL